MIQSLERALDIMEAIYEAEVEGLGILDLSRKLNLNTSTVHNLVKTLTARNYLFQDKTTKKYRLSEKIHYLSSSYLRIQKIASSLKPLMKELSDKTGEAAVLSAYYQNQWQKIAKVEDRKTLKVDSENFKRQIYTTASGRVLLAHMDKDELKRCINIYGFPGKDWDGITTWKKLKRVLKGIKKRNFSLIRDLDEVAAVACFVHCGEPPLPLALAVFLPAYRFQGMHRKIIISSIKKYTERMSNLLSRRR